MDIGRGRSQILRIKVARVLCSPVPRRAPGFPQCWRAGVPFRLAAAATEFP